MHLYSCTASRLYLQAVSEIDRQNHESVHFLAEIDRVKERVGLASRTLSEVCNRENQFVSVENSILFALLSILVNTTVFHRTTVYVFGKNE